jgi:hypothetical protein
MLVDIGLLLQWYNHQLDFNGAGHREPGHKVVTWVPQRGCSPSAFQCQPLRSPLVACGPMPDDQPDPEDDLAELISDQEINDDALEMSEHDINAHTLSVRRADGTEVMTVTSALGSGEQWSVYMQPGGGLQNAYVGGQDDPRVWVNTDESSVSRDEDGTYVIYID